MIQPRPMSYTFDVPQQPVLLDSVGIKLDEIPLLGTFHIFIFCGEAIAPWLEAGYQNLEGYENFRKLFEAPFRDAQVCSPVISYTLARG